MPPHSTVPASVPFAPSVWLVHSVSLLPAHARHSLEIPGYQENQLLPMAGAVNSIRHLPVPPVQQITHLYLLLGIIQEVQDTVVKSFGIRHGV